MKRVSLIILVGLIPALISFVPQSALAQYSRDKTDYGPTCSCQFGYGGNACVPAVSCGIEGGHCSRPCEPPPDYQAIH